MTKEFVAVIEAAYMPAAELWPNQWAYAFEGSPKAVEDYLAAAPEFQNARVDTFFIRFAVDTVIKDIKAKQAERELYWAFWFSVCSTVFENVLSFGLLWTGLAYGWVPWVLALCALYTAWCVVWWPRRIWGWIKGKRGLWELRRLLADALIRLESIQHDLWAESYDAATIERRLTELEREKVIKLPSYVFTLLKRRAATSLTASAGSDRQGRREEIKV
jgi:hypothetical protein